MQTKVLAVDDSKAIRLVIEKALGEFECVVSQAANGAEGLALATREQPDLILLDISMPVMDGITLLAILRQHPQLGATPVIVFSAELKGENAAMISKLGVSDCLAKPFTEKMLLQKVRQFVPLRPRRGIASAGSKDSLELQEGEALV
jgi:CheY-like chemotaxis protein